MMFKNYKYEKPAFVSKKRTDALTAAFAGGGWLHLTDRPKSDVNRAHNPSIRMIPREVSQ